MENKEKLIERINDQRTAVYRIPVKVMRDHRREDRMSDWIETENGVEPMSRDNEVKLGGSFYDNELERMQAEIKTLIEKLKVKEAENERLKEQVQEKTTLKEVLIAECYEREIDALSEKLKQALNDIEVAIISLKLVQFAGDLNEALRLCREIVRALSTARK